MVVMIQKDEAGAEQIVVETAGARDATFADFQNAMPKDAPRWAVYELEYKTEQDDRYESKLVFLMYSPDTTKEKNARFVYAQQKEAVKQKMSPVNKELQINDWADIKESDFIAEFN